MYLKLYKYITDYGIRIFNFGAHCIDNMLSIEYFNVGKHFYLRILVKLETQMYLKLYKYVVIYIYIVTDYGIRCFLFGAQFIDNVLSIGNFNVGKHIYPRIVKLEAK